MFIIDWWNALSLASQCFYCIAIASSLFLVIQTVLMFIGMGGEDALDGGADDIPDGDVDAGDVDGDMDVDLSDTAGFDSLRIFTVRGIVAFFVVFGWVGVSMDAAGAALWLTVPIAAVAGFAMMLVLAFLFRAVMRLRSDGNTDNRNAIGTSGRVQLTVPASRSGEGKVHLMLQGAYVERGAVTDEEEPIPTGAEVIVVGISGSTDLVVKRK